MVLLRVVVATCSCYNVYFFVVLSLFWKGILSTHISPVSFLWVVGKQCIP